MDKHNNSLTTQGMVLIVVLVIQYLLGMFINLYVSFPQGKLGGQLWIFAWKQISIAAHIILGILLLIGAIVFIVRAVRQKDTTWIGASVAGYIAIQAAVLTGSIFIPTQSAIYSYVMSLCFLIAVLSYGWGIFKTRG